MEKKKLSTAEILAKARAEKAAASATAAPPPAPEAAAASEMTAPAAESPAPSAPADKPAATPKSTKDILAAARAQAAGGVKPAAAAKPAAETAPAASSTASAGGPKGTKDILAAARAQAAAKAAGGAPATTATAAAATPKAPNPAVAATGGDGATPSVQDMLKAVRGETPATAPVVAEPKPAPVAPKVPVKPAAPVKAGKGKAAAGPRRNFLLAVLLAPFALAWMLITATGLVALLGAARFMFPNVLVEPPSKFKVGPPGDYPPGTVSNKWKAMFAIWIVNAEYQGKNIIYALSTVCTHLGCTPNWLDGEQKFKCPCHGSGFYITGVNFEGPAPRPLERYAIRRAEDGMLEVDKSLKFQQEMGQWEDVKSFVEVA